MFDHVYVLAEGYVKLWLNWKLIVLYKYFFICIIRHCVYQGSVDNTVPYLSSLGLVCPQYHNAADYMLEVANNEYGNFVYQLAKAAINERWRSSSSTVYINDNYEQSSIDKIDDVISDAETDEKRISVYTKTSSSSGKISIKSECNSTPSEMTRLWVLVARCNVQLYRDWTVTHLKLLLHILTAIVIGLYFGDSGVNANKSISNVGFLLVNLVYLWCEYLMEIFSKLI